MTNKKLTLNQTKVIEGLMKNPKISLYKLSIEININERNVRRHVRILKLMGLVRRVGPNHKDGCWEVLE